ncbi:MULTISPECIES: 30S ribosomal protein S14 [Acidiplasma]|jgi:small subunit ribosomal protein S14|uniref:30S ribosomal protein S14 n=1 Tax=Acidiplasma TaxID=507753 RepID=UPI00064ED598|nr:MULTISPECIES: 30S ribosomal protein S14 [Acidiplasma]WMT54564.1 MAG: 30S ribosomal protein S14 [Acidiplasma sp.]
MSQIKLQPKKNFGHVNGCVRCGRKRGIVRRYGINMCRQCFRETAGKIGFRKYS